MTRQAWEDLPDSIRDAVQKECGPVVKAETAARGITPGVAARLHIVGGGSVFIKAIETSSSAAPLHWREEWAAHALPKNVPAPALLMCRQLDGWHTMVFEFINDNAHHADLSPGSPDLRPVLDTVALLGSMLTPAPSGAVRVSANIEALMHKSRHVLDRGQADDAELYIAALERFQAEKLRGDTLIHYDLSSSNMLVAGGRVHVVDWAFAAQGAIWLDCALLAPRLIEAGHTPEGVDGMLSTIRAWRHAARDTLPGLAAFWTLFRVYEALHGPEEHREARARAADAGRSWMLYLLES